MNGDPLAEVDWLTTHGDKVTVYIGRHRTIVDQWRFYWNVKARNGEIVEHGQGYTRRRNAVRAALRHHPRVEVES